MSDANNTHITDPQFLGLIAMWSTTALQAMGKLVNPATGRAEKKLEVAQLMIDLLEMLERKTRGNLSDEERRQLRETLTMLRLNYVETASGTPAAMTAEAGAAAASAEGSAAAKSPSDRTAASGAAETSSASGSSSGEAETEDKAPRFHKSYG